MNARALRCQLIRLTLCAGFALSLPVHALSFSFSQSGFAGGGTIAGTFTGTDLDGNGQLSSFAGEVTNFTAHFTGNVSVPMFTLSTADLIGLVFDLHSDLILGNGTTGDVEGLAAGNLQVFYSSGLGPNGFSGGFVENQLTGVDSVTRSDITVVSEPPLPYLLALGIAAIVITRRLRIHR
jgi:hypothetical protein